MRAYYLDDLEGDLRLPHDSGTDVPEEVLRSIGVLHWHIPIDIEGKYEQEAVAVAKERGYKNHRDTIDISKEGMGDEYETTIEGFHHEHMHEDEEMRYLLEGNGFFDVREHSTERWIRCHTGAGDLIVLPAGIYHRFTFDTDSRVRMMRLFKDEVKWFARNRSHETDGNPYRVNYLKSIEVQ